MGKIKIKKKNPKDPKNKYATIYVKNGKKIPYVYARKISETKLLTVAASEEEDQGLRVRGKSIFHCQFFLFSLLLPLQ